MKNKASFLILLLLLSTLIFVVGVRYGGEVEKANKKIDSMVRALTPSPSVEPTKMVVTYKTYKHKQCAVEFLYPSYLEKSLESTSSAEFSQDNEVELSISCAKTSPFARQVKENKEATEVAQRNTATGIKNYFFVSNDLLPLLQSSLKFRR